MLCHFILPRLWLLPTILGLCFPVSAQQVLVTGVEGQVLYGAGTTPPRQAVTAGQKLGPGTFSAGNNGVVYLSAFDGSDLRLAESGTLTYDGNDELCVLEGNGHNLRSSFHLLQGKAQITIRLPGRPLHCYRIVLTHAAASTSAGQCVFCHHGSGTYLFVASGQVAVVKDSSSETDRTPLTQAKPPAETIHITRTLPAEKWLVADGRVGVIESDGSLRLAPLSTLAAGTQTCLLSGFNKESGGSGGHKGGPDAEFLPVVSPTQ